MALWTHGSGGPAPVRAGTSAPRNGTSARALDGPDRQALSRGYLWPIESKVMPRPSFFKLKKKALLVFELSSGSSFPCLGE